MENYKKIMLEKCDCELKLNHVKGEHDYCCQECGGNHTERICPINNSKVPYLMKKLLKELKYSKMEQENHPIEINKKDSRLIRWAKRRWNRQF